VKSFPSTDLTNTGNTIWFLVSMYCSWTFMHVAFLCKSHDNASTGISPMYLPPNYEMSSTPKSRQLRKTKCRVLQQEQQVPAAVQLSSLCRNPAVPTATLREPGNHVVRRVICNTTQNEQQHACQSRAAMCCIGSCHCC